MALEDAVNPMQGVSGPGKFAKRTDLEYQSTGYGDGVQMQAQMQGAPVASAPATPHATPTQVRQAASKAAQAQGGGLYAPTQRPQEPVTHGVDIGPGAGSEALMVPQEDSTNFLNNMQQYLPVISYIGSLSTTSPETRRALRQLRDQL